MTLGASSPSDSSYEAGGHVAGVAQGTVSNNQDPEGLARVKLRLPWRGKDFETDWVRIATPMGGNDRGVYFLPEVGDAQYEVNQPSSRKCVPDAGCERQICQRARGADNCIRGGRRRSSAGSRVPLSRS